MTDILIDFNLQSALVHLPLVHVDIGGGESYQRNTECRYQKGKWIVGREKNWELCQLAHMCPTSMLPPLLKMLYFFFFLINLFIYLSVLGLRCSARAISSCSEQGLLFVAVHRLLIVVASLVAEHRL